MSNEDMITITTSVQALHHLRKGEVLITRLSGGGTMFATYKDGKSEFVFKRTLGTDEVMSNNNEEDLKKVLVEMVDNLGMVFLVFEGGTLTDRAPTWWERITDPIVDAWRDLWRRREKDGE